MGTQIGAVLVGPWRLMMLRSLPFAVYYLFRQLRGISVLPPSTIREETVSQLDESQYCEGRYLKKNCHG